MLAALDTDALLELVWAAPAAVLVVTLAWAMVVHGATRAADCRREGRTVVAGVHAAVAGLGLALFTGAVVAGLLVMTSK
jgi:hypothetical protein